MENGGGGGTHSQVSRVSSAPPSWVRKMEFICGPPPPRACWRPCFEAVPSEMHHPVPCSRRQDLPEMGPLAGLFTVHFLGPRFTAGGPQSVD